MKKVAIIGKGTAGCLSAIHLSSAKDIELSWYFDPNGKTQLVGEGSTLVVPKILRQCGFEAKDLPLLNGTKKQGVYKQGWFGSGEFNHDFRGGYGYHFDASKLQNFTLEALNKKVNIQEAIVSHEDIDADLIVDCTGTPKFDDKIKVLDDIAVNSAYVCQCYWDKPRFERTLTIARRYGWVFGIPLQNRLSFGYLYNSDINTQDEIKLDLLSLIKDYQVEPSDDTISINFKSYVRNKNFDGRVAYNGNASFFLEPLEATSTQFIVDLAVLTGQKVLDNSLTDECLNQRYHRYVNVHKSIILCHYLKGSQYQSDFWTTAKEKANKGYDPLAKRDTTHSHWQDWNWAIHDNEFKL